jgi:hypothetical protein
VEQTGFEWFKETPQTVWMHGLYMYASPSATAVHHVYWSPPITVQSLLYVMNVTFHGCQHGFVSRRRPAYLAGAQGRLAELPANREPPESKF